MEENRSKRELNIDWEEILPGRNDEPPAELIVETAETPKPGPMNDDSGSGEELDRKISDRELGARITSMKQTYERFRYCLIDRGDKIFATVKRLEKERDRRRLCRAEMDVDGCEKPTQSTSSEVIPTTLDAPIAIAEEMAPPKKRVKTTAKKTQRIKIVHSKTPLKESAASHQSVTPSLLVTPSSRSPQATLEGLLAPELIPSPILELSPKASQSPLRSAFIGKPALKKPKLVGATSASDVFSMLLEESTDESEDAVNFSPDQESSSSALSIQREVLETIKELKSLKDQLANLLLDDRQVFAVNKKLKFISDNATGDSMSVSLKNKLVEFATSFTSLAKKKQSAKKTIDEAEKEAEEKVILDRLKVELMGEVKELGDQSKIVKQRMEELEAELVKLKAEEAERTKRSQSLGEQILGNRPRRAELKKSLKLKDVLVPKAEAEVKAIDLTVANFISSLDQL